MAGSNSNWRPPRSCEDYFKEFRLCKSVKHRFYEYYTYGKTSECDQWKQDVKHCLGWENTRSKKVKEALIEIERKRVASQNDFKPVWKLRQTPPDDWNRPLNLTQPQDS